VCGYLNWVSGATDNAIYPTLFLEYVTSIAGWEVGGWERFGYVAAYTVALALVNYSGLEIVGNASLMVCIIAKSPFVILKVVGGTEGGAESVVPIAGGECLQKRGAPLPRWLSNGTGTASPPHLHKHPFEALPQQHVLESQLLRRLRLLCGRDN